MKKIILPILCVAVWGCGDAPEKQEPLEIWTGWEVETDDPVVEMPIPNPIDACENSVASIPHSTTVPVLFDEDAVHVRCNGDERATQYFGTEIPPQHRLFVFGATDIRTSCSLDSCGETALENRTDETIDRVIEVSDYGVDDPRVRTDVYPLSRHSLCETPEQIWPDNIPTGDPKNGGEPINPCGLVSPRFTEYFTVQVPLGFGSIEVIVEPNDPQNLSLSVQAFHAFEQESCSAPEPRQCITASDANLRGAPVASIILDGSFGGGRDPATAYIAVSGEALGDSGYTVRMRSLDGPT